MRRDQKPVTPVLRSWGRGPLDSLSLALQGHEEGIHDLRVAARRLRTVLPILTRNPRRPRIRRAIELLRTMGDLAGASRDYDVKIGLMARPTVAPAAHRALLARLELARDRSRMLLAAGLRALDLTSVQGLLGGVAVEPPEPLFVVLSRMAQRRDALARDVEGRLAKADRFDADRLHRLRIRIRRLRYLADMYADIRGVPTPAPELKRLQDVLGDLQDAWVLSRWLTREAGLARRRGDRVVADYARNAARRWRETAMEHHREFLASDPGREIRKAVTALGGSADRPARRPARVVPVSPQRRKHKQTA